MSLNIVRVGAAFTFLALFVPAIVHAADPTPQFPLKSKRMLYSDEEIARAKENVKKYPAAKAVQDKIIKSADVWLNWSDADIRFLLTDSSVPRAFAVSASGCPVCGAKIKEHGGDYAWIMDPKL